jgi:tetratricopeptide (TPR) repeat protein
MRKAIWILIAVVLIVLFALLLLDNQSTLLMLQISSKTYSAKLWAVILCLILIGIALYILFSLISLVYRMPKKFKNSWKSRQSKQQQDYFFDGLEAYLNNDRDSLNKNLAPLLKDKESDSDWQVHAGLLLLDGLARGLDPVDDAQCKKIFNKLDEISLSDYQKFLIRRLRAKILQKSGQDLAACVFITSLLDDLESYYTLPKVGLSHYLAVLEDYGSICLRVGQVEALENFIGILINKKWLQRALKSQNAICAMDVKETYQKAISKFYQLIGVEIKDKSGDIWQLCDYCGLVNEFVILAYVSYLDRSKEHDKSKKYIEDFLEDNWSDEVFAYFVETKFIGDKEKLDFSQRIFSRKQFKPSFNALRLMGDICFANGLIGQAKKYYEQSLKITESALAYISLANIYLKDKDQKGAIESYQKGFHVLKSS